VSAGKYPWWMGPASVLGAALLWLLGRTWRIEERNDPRYDEAARTGETFILAFWHARQLPLAFTHRGRGVVVLVSRSADGELISRILARLGNATARGSSTRGGEAAIRELHAAADGPRGPAERAKEGLTFVAAQLGLRVVPLVSSARDSWVLRSWDRFRVPRPFARVCIAHGAPIAVARERDPETAERERARVEQALNELTAETARRSGERP
jgi:lysophospholipid acyltransferase (LPLAT)-like uncharacterized protein